MPARTNRPILILTAATGAGHTVAAHALHAAMEKLAPERATVEVVDVLEVGSRLFRRVYGGGYSDLVRHLPAGMGWLYDRMDTSKSGGSERLRRGLQALLVRKIPQFLEAKQPRLIVNTHFLAAEIVAGLRQGGRLDCPQVTVTTDFETHRMWVQPPTERYYTATELGKALLASWGVPAADILVTGIPVRAAFERHMPHSEARQRLGLAPDQPTVLLLSGGGGVGPTARLLVELLHMPAAAQIITVAGHNEPLRRRCEALASASPRTVRVIGYTESLHECMHAADLVVTKPGGLTTSEALASHLPMVLVNPIPGQETRNSDYLLEQGVAIRLNNLRLLGYRVGKLLECPDTQERMRARAAALTQPEAAERIAADALSFLPAGSFD